MGVKKIFATVLCASLSLAGSVAVAQTSPPTTPDTAPAVESVSVGTDLGTGEVLNISAQWLLAIALTAGAIAISVGVHRYNRNERWYRIEFLRKAVKEFEQDPEIWKALKILDFEEYRDYEIEHNGEKILFRVNNDLLCKALEGHDKRKHWQKTIDRKKNDGTLDPEALKTYQIETEIRDWFNKMLNGLEHFGYFVESGMFTAQEIRPWMIYWIRLIADRAYKRPDASKFYDQLYTYIHEYGFSGVIRLFESFGYRILPTPYQDQDFVDLSLGIEGFDLKTALSMAKAAYLIYQDIDYVKEISEYRWGIENLDDVRYFNDPGRDTQAFTFRTKQAVILAFRGSQEIKDWQTNISTRFNKFALKTTMEPLAEDVSPPIGTVHRGFQSGWNAVEGPVIKQLLAWKAGVPGGVPLFITGHSLGGALATVAAASLVKRGFRNIRGVYTFGQPRVGDVVFAAEMSVELKDRVFRFVNNNDVVPHVPPPYLPWNVFRIYKHVGPMLYFDARGALYTHPNPIVRSLDFVVGLMRDAFEPGFDMVNDHRMEYYISNLAKALEVEQMKRSLEDDQSEIPNA
jgi:hypothetical protein